MTTDIKEAARASARISAGLALDSGEFVPAEELNRMHLAERHVPLRGLTADEIRQRQMPWTGLTIAAAIVLACAAVALLVHAAGVHGWLR